MPPAVPGGRWKRRTGLGDGAAPGPQSKSLSAEIYAQSRARWRDEARKQRLCRRRRARSLLLSPPPLLPGAPRYNCGALHLRRQRQINPTPDASSWQPDQTETTSEEGAREGKGQDGHRAGEGATGYSRSEKECLLFYFAIKCASCVRCGWWVVVVWRIEKRRRLAICVDSARRTTYCCIRLASTHSEIYLHLD